MFVVGGDWIVTVIVIAWWWLLLLIIPYGGFIGGNEFFFGFDTMQSVFLQMGFDPFGGYLFVLRHVF